MSIIYRWMNTGSGYSTLWLKSYYMSQREHNLRSSPQSRFLCTRVSNIDEYYWKRFCFLLVFVKFPINGKLIIEVKVITYLCTWFYASYIVHECMCSHTGGEMLMGIDTLHSKSSKQKFNTKSSTEVALVVLSEYLTYNTWLIFLLK